jgi:predicted O-linked N-acetylglucosamine transferase (SPINDLY family)
LLIGRCSSDSLNEPLCHPTLAPFFVPRVLRPMVRTKRPRIRLGYVSADFRRHTRSLFVEPILEHHDRRGFEVYCYSDVVQPDETTARMCGLADVWRETARLSARALADAIRQDEIDILVDLTGHMSGNRLPTFALKPAPVQVAYPGYPNTTGLATIDYLITDADRDPPGAETLYTEQLVRLPGTSMCYRPPDDAPPVGPPPFRSAGHVTFGCLGKLVKVTRQIAEAWAKILAAVPRSRLLVVAVEDVSARRLLRDYRIDPDRVDVSPRLSRGEYMALYNQVDVVLDTFPYNGHTTSCDALWMGAPVVTLAGRTRVCRTGLNLLNVVGLPGLITSSPDAYVEAAVHLASDGHRLSELRGRLRGQMRQSPLCDGPGQTRKLEECFRWMWRCQSDTIFTGTGGGEGDIGPRVNGATD